jgi:hypothetical protein
MGESKIMMNEPERKAWEDEHRYPHMTRSPEAWMNHRWNPQNHPGNKIGGVILTDLIDPKTRMRMIVLEVPRRKRHVTVWISYPELIRLIEEAAPTVGERLGITFIGQGGSGGPRYSISLPDRPADAKETETADQSEVS